MPMLAIDQSYNSSGYCVVDENCIINFGIIKSSKNLDIYERAMQIADELVRVAINYQPTKIQIEGLAFGMRGNATRDLAGLLFTIITSFKRNNFHDIQIISPKTIKKTATGSGKATKKEMIENLPNEIKTKFTEQGFKATTGLADLADSYWLSKCVA